MKVTVMIESGLVEVIIEIIASWCHPFATSNIGVTFTRDNRIEHCDASWHADNAEIVNKRDGNQKHCYQFQHGCIRDGN